ncbi:hypothetical protein [Streptomyces pristinaespiralis]|uniref:hypothetical protein n=1 Tax=Streptomyces pristinaespiralis TaxID=38300 RepID=UPI0033D79D74
MAVTTSVFLTACSAGSDEQEPAHPVFDAALQQQPRQALLATRAAGTASFRQTLTFTSEHGDSVQTSEGRLDFGGSRAAGSQAWKIADGLPDEAKDALLGTRLGEGRSPARSHLAIDPGTIRLRSGEAAYWLRYDESAPFASGDSIDALRGTEAAFGGTLLEIVSGAQEVRQSAADGEGRTYPSAAADGCPHPAGGLRRGADAGAGHGTEARAGIRGAAALPPSSRWWSSSSDPRGTAGAR